MNFKSKKGNKWFPSNQLLVEILDANDVNEPKELWKVNKVISIQQSA